MATEGNSGAASGGQLEERTDFTIETDLALAQCASILDDDDGISTGANSSSSTSVLSDALQILFALEKRCRVGNDHKNLSRICAAAIQACYDKRDYTTLLATITSIATKRSQKVAAIRTLVTTAIPWCVDCSSNATITAAAATTTTTNSRNENDTITTMNFTPIKVSNDIERKNRNELIVCLREITDGKLFLERERAQLTRALASIKVIIIFVALSSILLLPVEQFIG
jgi:hypothetical protein